MKSSLFNGWVCPIFGMILLVCMLPSCSGRGQSAKAPVSGSVAPGGPCDGCELLFVGMPSELYSADTSVSWKDAAQQLIVTGTVYALDGVHPAAGVIIYYWQTDERGYYSPGPGMHADAKEHGRIRGWVKSDKQGRYSIYTSRPAAYPNEELPAHIHLFILEPGSKMPYYVDDLVFEDDPLLIPYTKKYPMQNRGGSGILKVLPDGKRQVAKHDIMLGMHIPDYR